MPIYHSHYAPYRRPVVVARPYYYHRPVVVARPYYRPYYHYGWVSLLYIAFNNYLRL